MVESPLMACLEISIHSTDGRRGVPTGWRDSYQYVLLARADDEVHVIWEWWWDFEPDGSVAETGAHPRWVET